MLKAMSTRRRTRTRDLLLIAGDHDDLLAMQHTLDLLPVCAYGQVFIEAGPEDEIVPVTAPSRMTVTWLRRGDVAGAALGAAISGWVGEWLPETDAPERNCVVRVGAVASTRIEIAPELRELVDELHVLPDLTRL